MALPTRRSYSGAADACTLSGTISAGDTSCALTGTTTNWPSTGTGPFFMVIDPGLATEEKVSVTTRSGGTISVMTRGADGTTAASHSLGATCFPVGAAVDFDEANAALSKMTTKGDLLVTTGSTYARLGAGTNDYALLADSSAANGLTWGQITATSIATGAVTSAKILDDTIVNADINSAAGIVDTKLATISTASKVSNSATTATSANTASAIVARDASGNFTAGTITAALTGTASGNLVSGGALGTPSSGTLTNCTFPTLNQSTTGNSATATTATNATNLVGLSKGSLLVTLNAASQGTFNHGVGSTPSTILLTNGDLGAATGHFAVISTSSSQVNFEGIGTAPGATVRVNFIAFA